jgi:hypothetical protein
VIEEALGRGRNAVAIYGRGGHADGTGSVDTPMAGFELSTESVDTSLAGFRGCPHRPGDRTAIPAALRYALAVWRDQGQRAEARDLLAPIYAWFTKGFDTRDLIDAEALLAELNA